MPENILVRCTLNVDLNLDKIGLVQVGAPHYALT